MKRIFFIVVIIVFVFLINNLVHSTISLWQKREVLVTAGQELAKEKAENESLHKQLTEVKDTAFVEEQARDKLILVKPGEEVVVIPSELIVSKHPVESKVKEKQPNWRLWIELFIN